MALDATDKTPDEEEFDPEDYDGADEEDDDEWEQDAATREWVNLDTGERVSEADWNNPTLWEDEGESVDGDDSPDNEPSGDDHG